MIDDVLALSVGFRVSGAQKAAKDRLPLPWPTTAITLAIDGVKHALQAIFRQRRGHDDELDEGLLDCLCVLSMMVPTSQC